MYVLEINAYQVVDGKLVAAIEEERIRRVKHWAPLRLEEVDHIAVGRDPKAHAVGKALYALRRLPTLSVMRDRVAFKRRTGTPVLLNTSFNENEPIVNTPAEAIDCFRRTAMDALIIGNAVVEHS